MKGEMGNKNAGGITTMTSGAGQGILSPQQPNVQQPSQIQRLSTKIGSLDDKLTDAKVLTDTKFT